ncbi:hypothetical protein RHGRI_016144 [Rhododendron griersonianum]|uniref:Uncharacterized protein n=1 Tax=Rhododendron griersonianum TaxID=479676 RepID=A0AAV6JT30_9ERIC|nr:hypothetical protein RHGRI_016144 [Rhododendron griersonianum]
MKEDENRTELRCNTYSSFPGWGGRVVSAAESVFKASIWEILIDDNTSVRAASNEGDEVWMPQLTQNMDLNKRREVTNSYGSLLIKNNYRRIETTTTCKHVG